MNTKRCVLAYIDLLLEICKFLKLRRICDVITLPVVQLHGGGNGLQLILTGPQIRQ